MYTAAFSPWVRIFWMPRLSISASASIRIVGTKNTCVTPYPLNTSATNRDPLIFGISHSPFQNRKSKVPLWLVSLHARLLDHLAPLRDVRPDELAELLRRAARRFQPEAEHPFLHVG